MLAGEFDVAERELRAAHDALEAVGERYFLSTVDGLLAQTLLGREALDEAVEARERSSELATEADVATQALWRCAVGGRSRRGSHAEARRSSARRSTCSSRRTRPCFSLDAHLDLGEVLAVAGDVSGARDAYTEARRLADEKGGVVILGTVIRRLESLDTAHTLSR